MRSSKTTETPMKILIPVMQFGKAGGYRVLSELANTWIRMGHECVFLAPSDAVEPYFPTIAKKVYVSADGTLQSAPAGPQMRGLQQLKCLYRGLQQVGSHYDVILANHSFTAWPVRWARCHAAKKFYYIQAYEPQYLSVFKKPMGYIFSKTSYLFRIHQITNSTTYKSPGLKPLACIPPGVDLKTFHQKTDATSEFVIADRITLGTIGRTEPFKGTANALAAYRVLRKNDDRFRMRVAFGNVEVASDLDIVSIKGDAALADFYRSVDALIVACQGQHGAPHYPLIEAMACGTPVIHTGYFPGDSTNSWQAQDTSVDAIVAATHDLIKSSDVTDRLAAARHRIEAELSWEATAARFLEVFKSV